MFSSLSNWFGQFFSMEGEPSRIQQDQHQRAADSLRKALECDEQTSIFIFEFFFFCLLFILYYNIDNHELAISLYKQSIPELEKAVNSPVDPNGKKSRKIVFFSFHSFEL